MPLFQESIASSTSSGWWTTQTGRLGDRVEFPVGHDDGDLEDAVAVGDEPRHFHVDPDERCLVLCHRMRECWGARIVSRGAPLPPITLNTFAPIFVVFALAALAWRLWLLARHARHVARHRDRVPADFAALVPPEAHAQAADYTRDKVRVAAVETVLVDGALLLAMSVGGGLALLDGAFPRRCSATGYARDLATVFAFVAVGAVASLPFDAWRTFRVEARHGFNQTTPGTFAVDIAKGIALAVALGTPLVLAVCWFIEATGAWWWVWAWVAWVAFTLRPRGDLPALDRAALQPLHAAGGGRAAPRASRRSWRAAASAPRASS